VISVETEAGGWNATDYIVIVDELNGMSAFRIERFEVDVRKAILRPVFDGGKTTADFGSYAQFRLVNPDTKPGYLYEAALAVLNEKAPVFHTPTKRAR
jgi:hypothetical protein